MINLGHILGKFTSSSVFLSLNSVTWLNANFYKDDKRSTPLITNKGFLLLIGSMLMLFLIYVALMVPEKVNLKKIKSYSEMLKGIWLILSNRGI